MKLVMLDGTNIFCRAFYGIRRLTTRNGLNTNAVSGFLSTLLRIIEEEKPDYLCVAMDTDSKLERKELYEGYKAQRSAMEPELAEQFPLLYELMDAMRVAHIEIPGHEADDIIGTLAKVARSKGVESVIVSGDRDVLQLIDDNTTARYVSTAMGRTTTKGYDAETFTAEYGFAPSVLVDLKALMGDSSDNIPGVAGVGVKTATDLIVRFGTLENVYKNLESGGIKPAVAAKLAAGQDSARLSYALAKINVDVPISRTIEELAVKEPDKSALYDLFVKLEFLSQINKLGLGASKAETAALPVVPTAVLTPENWRAMLDSALSHDVMSTNQQLSFLSAEQPAKGSEITLAVDCADDFTCISFYDGKTLYTAQQSRFESCENDEYMQLLGAILDPKVKKIAHNVKPVLTAAAERDIAVGGFEFDTALAAYILDPSSARYTIDRIALAYLGVSVEQSENNCVAVHKLRKILDSELEKCGMRQLYYTVELPLIRVVASMERAGMGVDAAQLRELGARLDAQIEHASQQIYSLAGEVFNINSTQHLGRVLFEKLSLPPVKRTKSGYSTDVEVLNKLLGKHPIIEHIIEFRQCAKLKSTYCDGLVKVIASDGRIHTNLNMMATATGRLSSTEPNLQNIPVRSEVGSEIRKMFVAAPGNVLVDADYSQIELRVLAHISGDRNLVSAFASGEDIHQKTVEQVFSDSDAPPSELRRRAKAVNFGIVYGISAFSLADDLGITTSEAKRYIESYLAHYSGVAKYMHSAQKSAAEMGFVTTLLGRRRYIPELKSSNYNLRQFGERVALNAPIQGSAADIIKLAMLRVFERLCSECAESRLIMQVHDELIVECPKERAAQVSSILTEEMERVVSLDVPLVAEAHVGATWYEAKA